MEGAEAEATKACKEEVNTENLGKIEGRFAGARVLPNLEVPVSPMPDRCKHQQSAEHNVGCGNTFEAPEAGIDAGSSGDAPATPAVRHAQAGHEGHHEHALTPHGVQDWIGGVKDGEFIKSHRAGPAGNEGCVHEVHGQQSAGVVDDDRVHPIPGQSHGSGSGERSCISSQTRRS